MRIFAAKNAIYMIEQNIHNNEAECQRGRYL